MSEQEHLTLPEEPQLARHIREAAARGVLSHAIILSGSGDLERAARFTAAAMECEGTAPPCGVCGACRKVLKNIHPDVITVEDPDHKNIAVDILRRTAAEAYILPNEGKRKIYLFPDCGALDPKAQNVLLKVLEEGPPHTAFLFCAENSSVLLPTIRSRAAEWKLTAGAETDCGDGARQLCKLLCKGNTAEIVTFCVGLENSKTDREGLRNLLSGARDLLTAGLASSYTGGGDEPAKRIAQQLSRRRIAQYADILETFTRQCSYNINAGHLTGALAAALTA